MAFTLCRKDCILTNKYFLAVVTFNGVHAGHNLNLLCTRQLDAAPFCENYAKPYSDPKHLEKELNRR